MNGPFSGLGAPVTGMIGQPARPVTLLSMKAIVITRLGGPEVLELREVPEPVASPGQALVRVQVGGLNFADLMTTQGGYPGTPKPPLVAGREFTGIEESTGRRVMGYTQWAAFAEKTSARPELLWPVPEGWTPEQAAAFPVNYFTAYFAYWEAGFLAEGGRGKRVLILGAEMYGTSSSEDKLARVKKLGLQNAINYKERDYEDAIKEMTGGEGVDAVFEMLGGEHTAKSIRCLRDFGKVIQYGTATGKQPQLDLRALYARAASVQGLWLTYLSSKHDLMDQAWKQLSQWIAEDQLQPVIGHVVAANEAAKGYELLMARKNFGKVVLKIA